MAYTPVFNGGLSCQGGILSPAPAPMFDPYPGSPMIPYSEPVPAPGPGINLERSASGPRPVGYIIPASPVASGGAGRATVVVRLPADARLYADGTPLRMTGGERTFVTPDLPGGMEYTYRLTAEYERNGEVVSVTRKVAVRAGGSGAVEFTDLTVAKPTPPAAPTTSGSRSDTVAAAPVSIARPDSVPSVMTGLSGGGVAGSNAPSAPSVPPVGGPAAQMGRATITVKLPSNATLFVDDRKSPSGDPLRRFTTPPLPAGREFGYLIRAEIVRNGQPESVSQKVAFRAGEQVVVDFSTLGTGP